MKTNMMNTTLLKIRRKKEVINRLEVSDVANLIREGAVAEEVTRIREVYHLMKPTRLEDGSITSQYGPDIRLPRICFAAEYVNRNKKRCMLAYNGLVVLEVNGLESYEQAVGLRNQVSRMRETLMAFLGASGRSVKIVCRGELYGTSADLSESGGVGQLPTAEADIQQFHRNLYQTARLAYQNQFHIDIEYLEPRLD